MKKILICGAGGFIGGHLTKYFIEKKILRLSVLTLSPLNIGFKFLMKQKTYP